MTSTSTPSLSSVRAGSSRAWLVAMRPRSLLVAISPVLVGAAFGYQDFAHCAPGTALNAILFRTFRLELLFAALLTVGALV